MGWSRHMNVRHTLNGTERTSGSRCSSPVANNGRDATSGGLLWVVAIVLEYSQHLQPPSAGALFYIDQLMFVVALGCWATAVWACDEWRPPATGWAGTPSRRGRSATSSWRRARVIPTVLDMFKSVSASAYEDNPLPPIGGALAILASTAAGIRHRPCPPSHGVVPSGGARIRGVRLRFPVRVSVPGDRSRRRQRDDLGPLVDRHRSRVASVSPLGRGLSR